MKEYLNFNKMITPTFIQILFWLGVVACVIAGLVMIVTGYEAMQKVAGLLTIVIGPLVVRIYAELMLVIFKIHGNLNAMRVHQEKQDAKL
ncbi:MAG: DUF4282 domain-containing protein [Planctomycetota bacterium]|nr:MAG: DUF4282 domain-containing protein [Planctomycetota bacterium]